jgi:hypothetical protein
MHHSVQLIHLPPRALSLAASVNIKGFIEAIVTAKKCLGNLSLQKSRQQPLNQKKHCIFLTLHQTLDTSLNQSDFFLN